MSSPIRVLIVDDHEIVRKGIRALLATKRDIQVISEARDGMEAVALAKTLHPDVILMDLMMPKMNGIQATHEITAGQTGTRVLVLTSFAADDQVFPAIKAGALGYLLKDSGPQELVQAIRQVFRGEPSLDPSVARKVLNELSTPPQSLLTPDPLTARELEILRLIAQGKSNKEISGRLIIAEETVHTHVSNILNKLHLASRTQAALYALKEGIASVEDIPGTKTD
ncbi:MAG: response regulator transcription factor [Anaerolineales bacterium]